jgi:polysaccharide transporter, PST family
VMLSRFLNLRQKITPNLYQIIANTSWLVADKLLRMVAGLFVGVWVARYLGPEQFGLFNYSMAFVALFIPLASLGLEEIVICEMTQHPEKKDEVMGSAFFLKAIAGFVSLAITTLSFFLFRSNSSDWILVSILAGVYVFQAFDVILFWFRSQVQSKYAVLAGFFAFAITTVLKVILVETKANLLAFAWVSLAEAFIIAGSLIFFYQSSQESLLNWKPKFSYAKKLLQKSYPMIFASFSTILYMKIDQVMLGQMLGDKAVGIYSVAVRISEIWYFIPVAIASSVTPGLITIRQESLEKYNQKIQTIFNSVVLVAYVISIVMSFFASPIISGLYGAAYAEATPILMVHIWASIFIALTAVRGVWLVVEDLTTLYMQTTAIGALTNIILNFILIPHYAGLGAAVATVISYAAASYLSCMFYSRLKGVFQIMNRALTLRWLTTHWFN